MCISPKTWMGWRAVGLLASILVGLGLSVITKTPMARAQVPDKKAPTRLPPPQPSEAAPKAPLPGHPETLACELSQTGFPPTQPYLIPNAPKPVESLVDKLEANDAGFEVVVGQGRLLTLKEDIVAPGKPRPLIAVGDPSTLDFVLVGPRQLRLIGQRIGVTDLSIITADNKTYSFEVQVVADFNILRCRLKAIFPDASVKLAQLRDHVVVEGEARDTAQVAQILETVRAYMLSITSSQQRRMSGQSTAPPPAGGQPGTPAPREGEQPRPGDRPANVTPETGQLSVEGTIPEPRIINLLRVPGSQQVMLKVRIAELNRTALREIGADLLAVDPDTGAIFGTQIGGAGVSGLGAFTGAGITPSGNVGTSNNTTVFSIFQEGNFEVFLRALRRNSVLKILAEPTLVAMNGEQASFLAGGQFPVPVPQVGGGGLAPTVTVQFKEFGVRLQFTPFILDNDVIRLSVDPEVSSIDFAIGATLVPGGSPIPGLTTRKTHSVVELRRGQTMALSGLLQLTQDGRTSRIPGIGDLPILGPFFSNTTSNRQEKELVVLVTPYLVEPMNPGQVPPVPGDEVYEPNDLELYLLNRIEGRTGKDFRSTTEWDVPIYLSWQEKLEDQRICGPHGFSD